MAGAEAAMLRTALARPISGAELLLRTRFAAELERRQTILVERREEAVKATQQRRDVLLACRRAREVLAQLRARALDRHRLMLEREAQLALDEIAGGQYVRRQERTANP
jgi:flagellar biosynthesis chaperone FliJ